MWGKKALKKQLKKKANINNSVVLSPENIAGSH